MSEVWLDGECVDFQGPAPSTTSEVWAVLEQFLGGAGKLLAHFQVDGDDWSPEQGGAGAYDVIRAESRTQEENLVLIVRALLEQKEALLASWHEVSVKCLSTGWASFQADAVGVLNRTQPLLENCGLLAQYGLEAGLEWGGDLQRAQQQLEGGLTVYMDALEKGDCVLLSDCVVTEMRLALGSVYEGLLLITGSEEMGGQS